MSVFPVMACHTVCCEKDFQATSTLPCDWNCEELVCRENSCTIPSLSIQKHNVSSFTCHRCFLLSNVHVSFHKGYCNSKRLQLRQLHINDLKSMWLDHHFHAYRPHLCVFLNMRMSVYVCVHVEKDWGLMCFMRVCLVTCLVYARICFCNKINITFHMICQAEHYYFLSAAPPGTHKHTVCA